jgi:hypothetical protein
MRRRTAVIRVPDFEWHTRQEFIDHQALIMEAIRDALLKLGDDDNITVTLITAHGSESLVLKRPGSQ